MPTPLPLPDEADPEFATPHENESTSISSLCLASSDSPLMSPIFAKMSVAIGAPPCSYRPILETAGGPSGAIQHYSATYLRVGDPMDRAARCAQRSQIRSLASQQALMS